MFFDQVITLLLAGEFVCPVSQQDAYLYLHDAEHRDDVNAYLGRLNLHLAQTRHEGAYFAAHNEIGGPERKAAREVFVEIKHNLRPIVSFLDMVMRVMEQDQFLSIGSTIEVNKMMAAIDANPSFRSDLQTLAMQLKLPADGTDRNRLDKVLKSFREKGYLQLANAEREIYKLTGKIEFIQEAIEFLMEHDHIPVEAEDVSKLQGTLL